MRGDRLLILIWHVYHRENLPGISSLQFHGPWVALHESELDVSIYAGNCWTIDRFELSLPLVRTRGIQVEP